jgi:hypothetical protein
MIQENKGMLTRTDIYHGIPSQQGELFQVSGRNLAHANRSVAARAFIGADLHLNRVALTSPTIRQCARLAGVCVPYVHAAVVTIDDPAARAAVLAGELTLLEAAKAQSTETLAAHFARSTPDEWLEAARVMGPGVVWDRMIAPLV